MAERNLNFDAVVNRKNTDCLKYDFAKRRGMPEDVLPLWVADMDFKTSSYIEDAVIERTKHGIFGYSEVQTPYFETVRSWMKKYHDWDIQEKWLIKTPGVVFALAMAVKAYSYEYQLLHYDRGGRRCVGAAGVLSVFGGDRRQW